MVLRGAVGRTGVVEKKKLSQHVRARAQLQEMRTHLQSTVSGAVEKLRGSLEASYSFPTSPKTRCIALARRRNPVPSSHMCYRYVRDAQADVTGQWGRTNIPNHPLNPYPISHVLASPGRFRGRSPYAGTRVRTLGAFTPGIVVHRDQMRHASSCQFVTTILVTLDGSVWPSPQVLANHQARSGTHARAHKKNKATEGQAF